MGFKLACAIITFIFRIIIAPDSFHSHILMFFIIKAYAEERDNLLYVTDCSGVDFEREHDSGIIIFTIDSRESTVKNNLINRLVFCNAQGSISIIIAINNGILLATNSNNINRGRWEYKDFLCNSTLYVTDGNFTSLAPISCTDAIISEFPLCSNNLSNTIFIGNCNIATSSLKSVLHLSAAPDCTITTTSLMFRICTKQKA